jgi:hypothetical protein
MHGAKSAQLGLDVTAGWWTLASSSDAECVSPLMGADVNGQGLGDLVPIASSLLANVNSPLSLQVVPSFKRVRGQSWPLSAPYMVSLAPDISVQPLQMPSIRGATPGACFNPVSDLTGSTSQKYSVSTDKKSWSLTQWMTPDCSGVGSSLSGGLIGQPSKQARSPLLVTFLEMGYFTCSSKQWGTCPPGQICQQFGTGRVPFPYQCAEA